MTIPNFWVITPEQRAKCLLLGIVVRKSIDQNGWVVQETNINGKLLVKATGPGKHFTEKFTTVDEAITYASKVLAGETTEYTWWPE